MRRWLVLAMLTVVVAVLFAGCKGDDATGSGDKEHPEHTEGAAPKDHPAH